jgi:hypothetical protein
MRPHVEPAVLKAHAQTTAHILRVLGPRTRPRVVALLRALGLSVEDARTVIEHGFAERLFEVDPAAADVLRVVPEP